MLEDTEWFVTEDGELVWIVMGAEGDDDDDDDDSDDTDDDADDDDDDSDDDDDADDDKGKKAKDGKDGKKTAKPPAKRSHPKSGKATVAYKPPSQAEWQRTQAALKKANDEQRAARKSAIEKAKQEGMTEAAAKAKADAEEAADKRYVPSIIRAHAKADLAAMGCKNPSRLMKLLVVEGITLDDNLEPIGLEAKLNELVEEWPEMFKADEDDDTSKKTKKTVKKAAPPKDVDGGDKDKKGQTDTGKKASKSAAMLASRLVGSSAE